MQRVIVTVKRENEARVRDLDVPADVPVAQLTEMITQALHWDTDQAGSRVEYQLEANPGKRLLKPEDTLESAQVWDGAWLVFHPLRELTEPPPSPPGEGEGTSGDAPGLVINWDTKALDEVLPQGGQGASEAQPGGSTADQQAVPQERDARFEWKRLG